ncbi:hypothetical protein Ahy_B09g096120 isoform K [Arachis hypogaea]|uniref:chloroplast protein-transporting ATPase n=1 Tax=Arachis hypogaea TaxID=3818 RepID=A0A444XIP1_ARAHY|nr:hypothetical protein Ahy_B09g096120 isoform K [Arachis hypogaea]
MAASSLCSSFTTKAWSNAQSSSSSGCRRKHHKTVTLAGFLRGDFQLLHTTSFPASGSRARRGRRRRSGAVASLGGLLGGIFKGTDTGESTRQQYAATVNVINGLEREISALSDSELRDRTFALRERAQQGQTLDSLLPEAFAVVREASKRVLGLRPFDVQLIGGMVLHKGEIAEMRTGEGKTLVAILPAYLNALTGKGVHVVTVNDYLARRDCEWVGQVPRFLGLKVGLIQQNMTSEQRKENYLCDITYVTNSELGFDYLRDNLATEKC